MTINKADRAQIAIDFDRCARERIGEQLGDAIDRLDLIAPNADGRRLTSAATAAAVFRELAGMIGAKDHFRVKAETLAGRMQRHRSAIVRALKALRDLGLLLHTRTGRSSLYSLDWLAARELIDQAAKRHQLDAGLDATETSPEASIVDPGVSYEAAAIERSVSASADRAPTDRALCAIGSRTVRQQMAHCAPSTPPLPFHPQENQPPPPAAGGGLAGVSWLEAERELARAGVAAIGAAVELARQRGYSPEQLAAIAAAVADTTEAGVRAYGPGVVFTRLKNGTPRQPIDAAFPPPSPGYRLAVDRKAAQQRQAERDRADQLAAAEADRVAADLERRLGARLDRMTPFERERLLQNVGPFAIVQYRRDPNSAIVRGRLLRALEELHGLRS